MTLAVCSWLVGCTHNKLGPSRSHNCVCPRPARMRVNMCAAGQTPAMPADADGLAKSTLHGTAIVVGGSTRIVKRMLGSGSYGVVFTVLNDPRTVLKFWIINQSNLGEIHERIATSAVSSVVDVGGLTEFFFTALWLAYLIFGQPFRDLHLAISYRKLIN